MKTAYLIAMIVLAIFLVGCSGQSTGNNQQQTEKKTIAEPTEDTTAQAAEDTTGQPGAEKATPDTASQKSLKSVLENKIAKYTGDYELASADGSYKMTMSFDYPKFATTTKTEAGEVRMIYDGAKSISCTQAGGEWMCFTIEQQETGTDKTESAVLEEKYSTTFKGACSVAGETGMEFEISGEGYTSTVCYTSDGILLKSNTVSEGQTVSMTATKISRSVSASEFVPPAEPKDLSSLIPNVPGTQ